MNDMSENKIDMGNLERAVTEATGSKAIGQFVKQTLEAGLQLCVGILREQAGNAMLKYQQAGRRMSARLPYGWQADPGDPARMIPCEYELEVVGKIKAWREEGLSLRRISDRLGTEGYQPRKVSRMFKGRTVQLKGEWRHGLINSILKRPTRD